MSFIIPDNILETLLCSFCHKYLSVKPVKVYPNRLIQCGRCVDDKEQSIHKSAGIESLYGIIAENILFKCVNKFDGCRELLKYSQVWHHEQVCLEKIQKCPICYEEMGSFLMLRHFRSNHKDAVLDFPAFVFNLNAHLEIMTSVYIYQEEDNLFFLYISYTKSKDIIKLHLVYMGGFKRAKNIYHQFTLSSENKEFDIVLNSKSCTNDFFVVDISHMSNFILIKFKLTDRNIRNIKVLREHGVSNAVRKPILKNIPDEHQIGKVRSEFNIKCVICQTYCIFSFTTCPIRYYYIDKDHNYLCYYCYQMFKYIGLSDQTLERAIPNEIFDTMKFFKWNCSNCCSDIEFSDMQSHEIDCKLGNQFSCPIQNCCEKGSANQMIEHLVELHNCMAFGAHFKLPMNILSCYVFVDEYIIFLHLTRSGNLIRTDNIQAELITKIDNDDEATLKPYVMFFDNRNALLNGRITNIRINKIFVKVVIQSDVFVGE
ncbi:uncharacterized protein [Diabrotica undecimpunctata]|uniref:uncharacterized protein n=1 Tax=Diabrotica undecimpunctata TaxID=50387 RepID=UPI003B638823